MTEKTTIMQSKVYQKLAEKNKASGILDCYKIRKMLTQSGAVNQKKIQEIKQQLLADINNILQSKYNILDYNKGKATQLFIKFKSGILKKNTKYTEKEIIKMKIETAKIRSLSSFLGFLEINKIKK